MSAAIGDDANDGASPPAFLLSSPSASSARSPRCSAARVHETFAARAARARPPLAALRGDREEPAARDDRARRRRRAAGAGRGRAEPDARQARRAEGRRERRRARLDRGVRLLAALDARRGRRRDARVAGLPRRVRRRARRAGALPAGSRPGSVDELLGALEGVSGTSARLDRHPAARARRAAAARSPTFAGTRPSLPAPDELARVFDGPARGGAPRAHEPARGLGRDRPRLLQLGAPRRPPAPARPVPRGPAARCATRASARTRAASRGRTPTPSPATSTPTGRRSPSAASTGSAGREDEAAPGARPGCRTITTTSSSRRRRLRAAAGAARRRRASRRPRRTSMLFFTGHGRALPS